LCARTIAETTDTVSISEYPPGSGGESTTSETEVIYVVLLGRLEITHGSGFEELEAGDSISFSAGEPRAAHNRSGQPARLLVIHQDQPSAVSAEHPAER